MFNAQDYVIIHQSSPVDACIIIQTMISALVMQNNKRRIDYKNREGEGEEGMPT